MSVLPTVTHAQVFLWELLDKYIRVIHRFGISVKKPQYVVSKCVQWRYLTFWSTPGGCADSIDCGICIFSPICSGWSFTCLSITSTNGRSSRLAPVYPLAILQIVSPGFTI